MGEIGLLDADGYLYLTDRASDLVVSGGVNIYPAEAEAVLAAHPGVADVAVIGVPEPDLGEALLALVVNDPEPVAEDLVAWCRPGLRTTSARGPSGSFRSCRGLRWASSASGTCANSTEARGLPTRPVRESGAPALLNNRSIN